MAALVAAVLLGRTEQGHLGFQRVATQVARAARATTLQVARAARAELALASLGIKATQALNFQPQLQAGL